MPDEARAPSRAPSSRPPRSPCRARWRPRRRARAAAARSMWSTPTVTVATIAQLCEAGEHLSRDRAVADEQRLGVPRGRDDLARRRATASRTSKPAASSSVGPPWRSAADRCRRRPPDITGRGGAAMANHWCILRASRTRSGKRRALLASRAALLVPIARRVADATTARGSGAAGSRGAAARVTPSRCPRSAGPPRSSSPRSSCSRSTRSAQIDIITFEVDWGWTLENYRRINDPLYLDPILRSLFLSSMGATLGLPRHRLSRRALDQPPQRAAADARPASR